MNWRTIVIVVVALVVSLAVQFYWRKQGTVKTKQKRRAMVAVYSYGFVVMATAIGLLLLDAFVHPTTELRYLKIVIGMTGGFYFLLTVACVVPFTSGFVSFLINALRNELKQDNDSLKESITELKEEIKELKSK
ncbi:hypothetical protein KKA47_06125 [bacterium]|nr:hypothetical protein [bacterium]